MWRDLLPEILGGTQFSKESQYQRRKNKLHTHMWRDLPPERLWVTQFSKVSQ